VAVAVNNVIGDKGKIPWHSKEELIHFKDMTIGFPVIMGRKTFEALGKPLPGRLNLIITSHPEFFSKFEDVKCFSALKYALKFSSENNFEKAFIAGGAGLYKEGIEYADEMIISRMNFEAAGDTFFPDINTDKWILKETKKKSNFKILIYGKKDDREQN